MPLFADRFSGHLRPADPRGPLFVAGGCVWPTIPAFRYAILSDDATGIFSFLNTDLILIQFTGPQPAHSFGRWILAQPNPGVTSAIVDKRHWPGETVYRWRFDIELTVFPGGWRPFVITRQTEKCNRDLDLPNLKSIDPDAGETGETFRMEQVEWDQDSPPS